MISLSLGTVTPSAWQARSEQKSRERQEAEGEKRIQGVKDDVERFARDIYIRHIEECQGSEFERRWVVRDVDIRVWLRHFFNPNGGESKTGEIETQVRVFCREIDETFVLKYTRLAALKSSGWLFGCRLT